MPGTVPPDVSQALASNVLGAGDPAPTGLSPRNSARYDRLRLLFTKGLGYSLEMGNRPQTLYGLADSPVALAAWMLDHDARSSRTSRSAFDGKPVGNLTRDEVLDNITLTWLTNTGISSGRLYWENTLGFFDIKGVIGPGGGERLPARALPGAAELDRKRVSETSSTSTSSTAGNHFAAWQEPELFTTESPRRLPVAALKGMSSEHDDRDAGRPSARSTSTSRRQSSTTCAGGSCHALAEQGAGRRPRRRASSWRRMQALAPTGRRSTTGARCERG